MSHGLDALGQLVQRDQDHECDGIGAARVCVKVVAVAELPTRFGRFRLVGFWNNRDGKEHVAMVHGDVVEATDVPVRLHSECLTGDVMGSLRCDCRDQLTVGLEAIQKHERGVLLYLRQEGRGIGLYAKLDAYALQEDGLDTYQANVALGHGEDERDYTVAAQMLAALGVTRMVLLSNNPDKAGQLSRLGLEITERLPTGLHLSPTNRRYLAAKAGHGAHTLQLPPTGGAG